MNTEQGVTTPKDYFNGKVVVITGNSKHTRADVRRAVLDLGGHIVGAVTNKVDIVLFGRPINTSKAIRAKELDLEMWSISHFMEEYSACRLQPAAVNDDPAANFMYHFKTTIMVDLSLGSVNIAELSDTPNPQYQRVLHCHGFINIDEQPLNNEQVAAFEHCIMTRARDVAEEQFGLERVIVEKAVIIIDSINLIGSNQ